MGFSWMDCGYGTAPTIALFLIQSPLIVNCSGGLGGPLPEFFNTHTALLDETRWRFEGVGRGVKTLNTAGNRTLFSP